MPPDLRQPELARRIRAAMAYGRVSRARAASILGVAVTHLDRYTSGRSSYAPASELVWELADECGLPRAWFYCDLNRLAEIVPDAAPHFSPTEEATARARAATRRLARNTEPSAESPRAPDAKNAGQ